jgi:hypothetical protein
MTPPASPEKESENPYKYQMTVVIESETNDCIMMETTDF